MSVFSVPKLISNDSELLSAQFSVSFSYQNKKWKWWQRVNYNNLKFLVTESTNIASILWSEKLKQGYRFCAQPIGKVCFVSIVVRTSEFTINVTPRTSLALLYFSFLVKYHTFILTLNSWPKAFLWPYYIRVKNAFFWKWKHLRIPQWPNI